MTNPTPLVLLKNGEPPMSKLQDALDRLEAWTENGLTVQLVMDLGVAVDAARRVVNLDIDAAIEARFNYITTSREDVTQVVMAALGITEDTE